MIAETLTARLLEPGPVEHRRRVPLVLRAAQELADAAAPEPARPLAGRGARVPRKAPKVCHPIDRARLLAAGCLDPLTALPSADDSPLAEELRVLARPLIERTRRGGAAPRDRMILVTSAGAAEGKTFLAVNLALGLALEGAADVLLIDADAAAAEAGAAALLGLSPTPGLTELLAESRPAMAAILRRTDVDGLSFVAPGGPHPELPVLLAGRRMAAITRTLLESDPRLLVIVDAPPLLGAGREAAVLAGLCGQTVLVVDALATPRRAVDRALALVGERSDARLVLNRALPGPPAGKDAHPTDALIGLDPWAAGAPSRPQARSARVEPARNVPTDRPPARHGLARAAGER